jgi:hypothetical protein
MTEFKKLQDQLPQLEAEIQQLSGGTLSTEEALSLFTRVHDVFHGGADGLAAKTAKLKARAQEPDPEKRIYGPSMTTKARNFIICCMLPYLVTLLHCIAGARVRCTRGGCRGCPG